MKWLLTTKSQTDMGGLWRALAEAGAEPDGDAGPIPMGDDEQVVEVIGPRDLPRKLGSNHQVLKVSPNSEMELF